LLGLARQNLWAKLGWKRAPKGDGDLAFWGVGLCALLVGWPLTASTASCPSVPGASVSVAAYDGVARLSVIARGVPLGTLTSAVACMAGFQITGTVLTERTVSIEFARLPLDRALKRLLAGENVIFLYDPPAEG